MEKRSGIITKCKSFIKCETHRFFGTVIQRVKRR